MISRWRSQTTEWRLTVIGQLKKDLMMIQYYEKDKCLFTFTLRNNQKVPTRGWDEYFPKQKCLFFYYKSFICEEIWCYLSPVRCLLSLSLRPRVMLPVAVATFFANSDSSIWTHHLYYVLQTIHWTVGEHGWDSCSVPGHSGILPIMCIMIIIWWQ